MAEKIDARFLEWIAVVPRKPGVLCSAQGSTIDRPKTNDLEKNRRCFRESAMTSIPDSLARRQEIEPLMYVPPCPAADKSNPHSALSHVKLIFGKASMMPVPPTHYANRMFASFAPCFTNQLNHRATDRSPTPSEQTSLTKTSSKHDWCLWKIMNVGYQCTVPGCGRPLYI